MRSAPPTTATTSPDSVDDLAHGVDGRWQPLADDPLDGMVFRDGLDTPYGLLLLASDVARSGPTEPPPLLHAAPLDPTTSTWRRLPDSDQILGGHWTWSGERAIDATPGSERGSDSSYGRAVPFGGALTLPDGTWSRLPQPPVEGTRDRGWPVEATGRARVATGGQIYDAASRTWTAVPAPQANLLADEPGPAVWTSRGLVVVGARPIPTISVEAPAPARRAWIYHAAR